MDAVQALAIVSSGVFLIVLVTAIIYALTVRPRMLEPVPFEIVGLLDEHLHAELIEQRTAVEELNAALTHHSQQLAAGVTLTGSGEESLHGMLRTQGETVQSLTTLLSEQSTRLAHMDERLTRQEQAISAAAQQVETRLPGISERLTAQDDRLKRLNSRLDSLPTLEATSRLETRLEGIERRLNEPPSISDPGDLSSMILAQSAKLVDISTRLDEWATSRMPGDEKLAEHARLLAALDRKLASHAETIQDLDTRVGEHTTMLLTAATERREQASLLDRILDRVGEVFPILNQLMTSPPRPQQDRLTDIKGIGPVYAGKLYEAGIHTYRQLAATTPEMLKMIIDAPGWRERSIDPDDWIRQARLLADQREKVETIR
jgi:hypothetical protein